MRLYRAADGAVTRDEKGKVVEKRDSNFEALLAIENLLTRVAPSTGRPTVSPAPRRQRRDRADAQPRHPAARRGGVARGSRDREGAGPCPDAVAAACSRSATPWFT
jgi:hypothetical protein